MQEINSRVLGCAVYSFGMGLVAIHVDKLMIAMILFILAGIGVAMSIKNQTKNEMNAEA